MKSPKENKKNIYTPIPHPERGGQRGVVAENVGALAVYSESTLKAAVGKLWRACAFTVKVTLKTWALLPTPSMHITIFRRARCARPRPLLCAERTS